MYSSIYAYPWDVQDETPATFCATVREQVGVDTVSLAVSYHAGKLLLPHNPRRRVYYPEDGALFFRPDLTAFNESPIKPHMSATACDHDSLRDLCDVADKAGLGVIAWAVTLHNSRLGMTYPEYTVRNAFDDPVITYLCPAHAAVRAYISALAADLAHRYPLRAIQLESAHHMPFVHGFHHEMQQVSVTPSLQFLLGLCFCAACLEQAQADGIDGKHIRHSVAVEIDRLLADEQHNSNEHAGEETYGHGEFASKLQPYLVMRTASVRQLWREIHQAVDAVGNVPIHLQDPTPNQVQPSYYHSGIELPPQADLMDGVTMLGYCADITSFQLEVACYCALVQPQLPLEVGLRPVAPDCLSAGDLARRVAYCAERQVTGISFYNYGMLPVSRFRWIREALSCVP